MTETLSQDEVDALLRGISDGEVAVGEDKNEPGTARPYDLVCEERLVGRQFPALDSIHERFVRRLRQSLGSFVGVLPNVEQAGLEMLKFGTFRNRIAVGSSVHVYNMSPLRGQALMVLSAPFAFGLVDRIFGGAGKTPATLEPHEYSAIETQMIQRLVIRVLQDLNESWAPVHHLDCSYGRSEINPALVSLTGLNEMVLTFQVQCDFGSGPATLTLTTPYALLEPLRAKLGEQQASFGGADRDWLAAMTSAVRHSDVTLSAELGTREIAARELLSLRVGDVISLGTRGDDPVALCIEGVRLMTGLAGVSRGQNAVRILVRDLRE
jgi:flagellar motor switch protein FliM